MTRPHPLRNPALLLVVAVLAVFSARPLLASVVTLPHTFHLFDTVTAAGALLVLAAGSRHLRPRDWAVALLLGGVVGVGMLGATLFTPYPFLGVVSDRTGQALLRGGLTTVATLGGLVILRRGGPVPFPAADGDWRTAGRNVALGLALGLPLALVNTVALVVTQGRGVAWQAPGAAALDALQPGIVEAVVYRFALWGLLWLLLRDAQPARAVRLAGALALLMHTFAHFDDLFVQAPLAALGMGAVMALLWGVPLTVLARRRGLEAAIAFHWLQDVARFAAGF